MGPLFLFVLLASSGCLSAPIFDHVAPVDTVVAPVNPVEQVKVEHQAPVVIPVEQVKVQEVPAVAAAPDIHAVEQPQGGAPAAVAAEQAAPVKAVEEQVHAVEVPVQAVEQVKVEQQAPVINVDPHLHLPAEEHEPAPLDKNVGDDVPVAAAEHPVPIVNGEHGTAPDAPAVEEDPHLFADQDADWNEYGDDIPVNISSQFEDEYKRYLAEMTDEMMRDPAFRDQLMSEIETELKNFTPGGQPENEMRDLLTIATKLKQIEVRSKLDEQERQTVEQMRRAARRGREHDLGIQASQEELADTDQTQETGGLSAESANGLLDLTKQRDHTADRVKLMGHIDKERHEAFLQKEMERFLDYQKSMASIITPAERDVFIQAHKAAQDALARSRGAEPGHKKQLLDVWKNNDGMEDMEFSPRTFFNLHDINTDGFWDIKEVEALQLPEARKLHTFPGILPDEMAILEEAARMREHFFKEYDLDVDGLISAVEFLARTKAPAFGEEGKAWEAVDPQKEMTAEKLRAYEAQRAAVMKTMHKELDPTFVDAGHQVREDTIAKILEQRKKAEDMAALHRKDTAERLLAKPVREIPDSKETPLGVQAPPDPQEHAGAVVEAPAVA